MLISEAEKVFGKKLKNWSAAESREFAEALTVDQINSTNMPLMKMAIRFGEFLSPEIQRAIDNSFRCSLASGWVNPAFTK